MRQAYNVSTRRVAVHLTYKCRTPSLRFVVNLSYGLLLYNKLYDKQTSKSHDKLDNLSHSKSTASCTQRSASLAASRTTCCTTNYVLHTSFRKIFRTRSTDVVLHCMHMFNCPEAEDAVLNIKGKFLIKYASLDNLICSVCQNFANPETAALVIT